MSKLTTLIRKDMLIFLADPVAVGLGFVVPLAMILVFGLVFGGGDNGLSELEVLAVNQDQGPAGRRLLAALDSLDEIHIVQKLKGDSLALDSATARTRVANGKTSAAIIVPKDFSDGLKAGQVRLTILEDPHDKISAGIVSGLLQRQVFSTFPGLMPMAMTKMGNGADSVAQLGFNQDLRHAIEKNYGAHFPDTLNFGSLFPENMILGSDPDTSKAKDTSGFSFDKVFNGIFQVKLEAVVGQNIVNPGIAQSVAGPAVMFMLFAVGAIGALLLREMRDGTAQRLMISGVSSGTLFFSRYLWSILLGSGQLVIMMLYGKLIFGLDIFALPVELIAMIFCTAAAMSGFGLFIAALSRTEEQASGYQVVIILTMSAIGGAMIPSMFLPSAIRTVAKITPVHWAMQGFTDIFWRQHHLMELLPVYGVLLLMAAIMVVISIIVFRKRLATELG